MNPRDLDEVLRDLRAFDNDRVYADPKGLEQLQAAAIEKLKKFEFTLRRKADDRQRLAVAVRLRPGARRVPAGDRGVLPLAREEDPAAAVGGSCARAC